MEITGIPTGIRTLVLELYRPRYLEFTATENLDHIGEPHPAREGVNRVFIQRGIMMGDPLTKVILHLQNLSVRIIQENCTSLFFWNTVLSA